MEHGGTTLEIRLYVDDSTIRGAAGFRPVLQALDRSFLARPVRLHVTDRAERDVTGYRDKKIEKALGRQRHLVTLRNAAAGLEVLFSQERTRSSVGIFFPVTDPAPAAAAQIRQLFLDLIGVLSPTYGVCHLLNHAQRLHDTHYAASWRTFYASGLFWLNFFGPEELERQGGPALAHNPYASVERMAQGLLIQVGAGPLDTQTPEGERLLLQATAAMPALGESVTAQAADEAAELITVAGVRGFYTPGENAFWVTKNLAPAATLDAKTIVRLQALVGTREPPIAEVRVLFSRAETARHNRANLTKAGLRTWYVDPQTGDPHEA